MRERPPRALVATALSRTEAARCRNIPEDQSWVGGGVCGGAIGASTHEQGPTIA